MDERTRGCARQDDEVADMTPDDDRLSGPRALTFGCALFLASVGAAACGACAALARAEALDQSSDLAHHMDNLVVSAAAEWGFDGLRPHAAVGDLPPGVMASTQRAGLTTCYVVFDVDAAWWPEPVRWTTALHEVSHCRWPLYAVAGGGLSEHNPDPASIMYHEYRAGQSILPSDRAAVRPYRVFVSGVNR